MDNPVVVSAVTAIAVALLTTLIPRLFSKHRDDTDIMVQLQKIAADAVSDKAEMQKEIARLEKRLDERTRPIRVIVDLETAPVGIIEARATYMPRPSVK